MDADGSDPVNITNDGASNENLDWGAVPVELVQGDVDCDGDADPADSPDLFAHMAELAQELVPACPFIGAEVASLFGDVDCDGDVDLVDAIKVLRYFADLPVDQTGDCIDIGDPLIPLV